MYILSLSTHMGITHLSPAWLVIKTSIGLQLKARCFCKHFCQCAAILPLQGEVSKNLESICLWTLAVMARDCSTRDSLSSTYSVHDFTYSEIKFLQLQKWLQSKIQCPTKSWEVTLDSSSSSYMLHYVMSIFLYRVKWGSQDHSQPILQALQCNNCFLLFTWTRSHDDKWEAQRILILRKYAVYRDQSKSKLSQSITVSDSDSPLSWESWQWRYSQCPPFDIGMRSFLCISSWPDPQFQDQPWIQWTLLHCSDKHPIHLCMQPGRIFDKLPWY